MIEIDLSAVNWTSDRFSVEPSDGPRSNEKEVRQEQLYFLIIAVCVHIAFRVGYRDLIQHDHLINDTPVRRYFERGEVPKLRLALRCAGHNCHLGCFGW